MDLTYHIILLEVIIFFDKLKDYIKNYEYIISLDLDEYFYLGCHLNIKTFIEYYSPFDSLYIYWNSFKDIRKKSCKSLIDEFLHSMGIEFIGKSIAKINKIIGQTSPHCFDTDKNTIYYPEKNYNFISKDVFNMYFKLSENSGLNYHDFNEFIKNKCNFKNIPYIAHYRIQSIETFVCRRYIDRSILIKNNKYLNEHNLKMLCEFFMGGKNNYYKIMGGSFWTLTNPNIDEVIDFIYGQQNTENYDVLNKYEDGTICIETVLDMSKLYWNAMKYSGNENLDLYNFYKKTLK